MDIITRIETARGQLVYTLFGEPAGECALFGISVVSRIFGSPENAEVRNMTADRAFAERLLYMLADNLILPSSLTDVVREYTTAYIS